MKTIHQNENIDDNINGMPRVDMETGEVYQKSTFKMTTDDFKVTHTHETTHDANELTMYQQLELEEGEQPAKENNRDTTRDDEIELSMKLSHRY